MARLLHGNRVELDGEWDFARQEELAQLFDGLGADREVTIDMAGCTFADPCVLSALVTLRAKLAGAPVTLLDPSPHLLRVLKISHFDKLFRIVATDS